MPAAARDRQSGPDDPPRLAPIPAGGDASGDRSDLPVISERSLQASGGDRIYQAAGDQYIYHRQPAPPAVSNTLPRDTAAFTGRIQEVDTLVRSVTEAIDRGAAVAVHAIDGMPGIGKTALAVHAGHLLAEQFPAGQFFIDLHAHTAGHEAVRPTDALFAVLRADGMEATQIPADLDARAALWRGRMAGKRVLLILDNAAGRHQVEHLLPGTPDGLVLVTSRRRLTGLGARYATRTFSLETMHSDQARSLLANVADRSATGPEAAAINELVRLCGYLPLAICLLASRLRPEPHWRVADLCQELTRAKSRLARMHAEDVAVAAAFGLSYDRLPAARRRFFRRLGLHPGAELDAHAAAALDGIPVARAERHLDALYDDHLLDQPVRGRYRMHDLIREYARTRANSESERDRAEAVDRLLDHYQSGAEAANRHLVRACRASLGGATAAPPDPVDRRRALEWMAAEHHNLFACADLICGGPNPRRIIAFARAMAAYVRSTGPRAHAISLQRAAATAARKAGAGQDEADALRELGTLHRMLSDHHLALESLNQALDLYRALGHDRGIADALTERAGVRWRARDRAGAVEDLDRAVICYQYLDEPHGLANALTGLGTVRSLNEDHLGALRTLRRALAIYGTVGDRLGEATALNQLGTVHQLMSDYCSAIQAHRQALVICREFGDRHEQAGALNRLGAALCYIGDYDAAREFLTEAVTAQRTLGHPRGEASALNYLGIVHRETDEYAAAERLLTEALTRYRDVDYQCGVADALNQLGTLRRLTGDLRRATSLHEQAIDLFQKDHDRLGEAEATNELGVLYLVDGRPAQALDCFRRALRLARRVRNPREEARSLEGLGRYALRCGDLCHATEQLRLAETLYRRCGAVAAARRVAELVHGSSGDRPPEAIDPLDRLEKSA